MARILIAIPTYDRKIDIEILQTILQLPTRYPQHVWGIDFIASSVITYSRNHLVKSFLDKTDCDWLYFWDADVVIKDLSFIEKLIETSEKLDAAVVGGAYRIKHPSGYYAIAKYREGITEEEKAEKPFLASVNFKADDLKIPQLVDCIATGSMLIRRDVLEKIPEPWFQIFDYPKARMWSEDFVFCDKVHKAGFKVAVDPRFDTYHYGAAAWPHLSGQSDPK